MDERAREAEQRKETRGREAQQILEAPLFKEAMDGLRDACLGTFAKDNLTPEELLRLWLVYRLFLKFEQYINKAVREGADASRILAAMMKTDLVNGQG